MCDLRHRKNVSSGVQERTFRDSFDILQITQVVNIKRLNAGESSYVRFKIKPAM